MKTLKDFEEDVMTIEKEVKDTTNNDDEDSIYTTPKKTTSS